MQHIRDDIEITKEIAECIEIIWADSGIKAAFELRAKLGVFDTTAYFFDHIKRIVSCDYVPTQDVCVYYLIYPYPCTMLNTGYIICSPSNNRCDRQTIYNKRNFISYI